MPSLACSLGTSHSEIIVDGVHWNEHLPDTIEAFFGGHKAREQRASFLSAYPQVKEADIPLLTFDHANWEQPFALMR
jgi:hypothetical protein